MMIYTKPIILYCRIGWMERYSGIINNDKPIHGGSYTKDNIGHEVYNFLECDGKYYGYVENKSIHIERLGASRNEDKIDNVLVIWFAKAPKGGQKIVGWYKNATVYRHRQKIPEQIVASREIKDVVDNMNGPFTEDTAQAVLMEIQMAQQAKDSQEKLQEHQEQDNKDQEEGRSRLDEEFQRKMGRR